MLARLRSLPAASVDLALAAAVGLAGVLEASLVPLHGSRPLAVGSVLVQAVGLAFRRRHPLLAGAVVLVAFTGAVRLGLDSADVLLWLVAILIAMYTLGGQASGRLALAGLVLGVVVTAAGVSASRTANVTDYALGLVIVGVPWAVGRVIRERGAQITRLESDQEERARRAVADERGRIARELHDVVAHSMGVMVVQAQAAERMLAADPNRSRVALRQIQVTGREGLEEMHRLVGILRESSTTGIEPQGSLRHLDALLDQVRRAGLQVEATVDGDVNVLPPGVDLAAYRIVQEALTNTLKHAPGAIARVHVERSPSALRIAVEDEGGAAGNGSGAASGNGLIGMRERALLYGGELAAGPRDGGGFAVTARLDLR
jgi:signal transduction histidine kinase